MTARAPVLVALASFVLACASPDTVGSHLRRGRALQDQARAPEAEAELRRALELAETQSSPSLDRAHTLYALGDLYLSFPFLEDADAGEPLLARAAEEYAAALGDSHPAVGVVWVRLAEVRQEEGDREGEDELRSRAAEIFQAALPTTAPLLATVRTRRPLAYHPQEVAMLTLSPAAGPGPSASPDADPRLFPVPSDESAPAAIDTEGTYLRPNVRLRDGSPGYLHVRPDDMPWVIAIGTPPSPPKYGSSQRAREVAIEAMRMWESALRPHLPWFQLLFVEEDPFAHVQVEWKRRVTGPWAGFGRQVWWERDGMLRVGGRMEVSTTPDRFVTLRVEEVGLLIAHEFGHVLGLGHCLECDSAMNYSWHTRDRVVVTETDVRTFLALVDQPVTLPH